MHLLKLLKLRHIQAKKTVSVAKRQNLLVMNFQFKTETIFRPRNHFSIQKVKYCSHPPLLWCTPNIYLGWSRRSMILLHEEFWLIVKRLGIACSSLVACLPACLSTSSFDSHYGQFIGDLVKPTWQTFTDRKKTAAAAAYTPRCFLQKPRRVLLYRWS